MIYRDLEFKFEVPKSNIHVNYEHHSLNWHRHQSPSAKSPKMPHAPPNFSFSPLAQEWHATQCSCAQQLQKLLVKNPELQQVGSYVKQISLQQK